MPINNFNYALYKLRIESVIVILNHNIGIVLDEFSFILFFIYLSIERMV